MQLGERRKKLIEAVARALCLKRGFDPDGPTCDVWAPDNPDCIYPWAGFMPEAEAALTAIGEQGYAVAPREPTEAMQREGFRNNRHVNSEPCDKPTCIGGVTMPADRAYRAMIAVGDIARPGSEAA